MSSNPIAAQAPDLKNQVQREATEFAAAFNRRDFDKIASFYSTDATILPPNHEIVQGGAQVSRMFQEFEQAGATDLRLEVTRAEQYGDVVLEFGRYSLTLRRPNSTSTADRGKYIIVRRRQPSGEYRIYVDCWNSDLPPIT
jgi:ketosteroid isomerase-like protein